jgi:ABC-type multidrug transport system fused ATPase/permease subunit
MSGNRGRPGGRPKNPRGSVLRFMVLLRREWPRLAVVAALDLVSVLFTAIGPLLLGEAINIIYYGTISRAVPGAQTQAQAIAMLRAHGEGRLADIIALNKIVPGAGVNIPRLGHVLALAIIVYVLATAFNSGQGYLMSGIALRTVYRLRQSAEEKLGRMPLRSFDSRSHGDILSRITNDIDNINTTLQQGLNQLISAILLIAGLLTVMILVSPLLTAVTLLTVPLTVVVTILVAHWSRPRFAAQWRRTGRLNGLVEETDTGHMLVLASGQDQHMTEEFDRQNKHLYEASFRAQVSSVIGPAVQLMGNFNYVLIAAIGGYQVATAALSLGSVQAFIQYTRRLTIPMSQIASLVNQFESGLASAERMFEFLDAPEEVAIEAGPDPVSASGVRVANDAAHRIQFEHVCFRYDADTPLIEDFTLEAAPGHTVAIVGPTGAGKTTVVNLLMRFYEIDSGRILLDGVDYRDLSRDQARSRFGMVLQDAWLFSGTVRENIAYGKEGASEEQIVEAAKAADVDTFVRVLPHGYDTVLDSDGSSLSSGQKQLLTIARVFLADPGVLILDEATSNVDARTETEIQDAMTRVRAGRTSFVIAHRLSTIRDADTIVVLDDGQIVEQGSHEELLLRGGFYHRLYNDQFAETS